MRFVLNSSRPSGLTQTYVVSIESSWTSGCQNSIKKTFLWPGSSGKTFFRFQFYLFFSRRKRNTANCNKREIATNENATNCNEIAETLKRWFWSKLFKSLPCPCPSRVQLQIHHASYRRSSSWNEMQLADLEQWALLIEALPCPSREVANQREERRFGTVLTKALLCLAVSKSRGR